MAPPSSTSMSWRMRTRWRARKTFGSRSHLGGICWSPRRSRSRPRCSCFARSAQACNIRSIFRWPDCIECSHRERAHPPAWSMPCRLHGEELDACDCESYTQPNYYVYGVKRPYSQAPEPLARPTLPHNAQVPRNGYFFCSSWTVQSTEVFKNCRCFVSA